MHISNTIAGVQHGNASYAQEYVSNARIAGELSEVLRECEIFLNRIQSVLDVPIDLKNDAIKLTDKIARILC